VSAIRIGGADRTRQEPRCASSGRSRRMRRRTGWDDGEAARYFNLLQLGPALCLVGGVEFVRHVFVKIHTGLGARDDARVCRTVYTPVCRNTSVQTGPGRCACNNCSTGAHLTAFPSLRRATFPKPVSTTHTLSATHERAVAASVLLPTRLRNTPQSPTCAWVRAFIFGRAHASTNSPCRDGSTTTRRVALGRLVRKPPAEGTGACVGK
jgi:hypothetical protein